MHSFLTYLYKKAKNKQILHIRLEKYLHKEHAKTFYIRSGVYTDYQNQSEN